MSTSLRILVLLKSLNSSFKIFIYSKMLFILGLGSISFLSSYEDILFHFVVVVVVHLLGNFVTN